MKIQNILFAIIASFSFASCLKSETPITLPPSGGGVVMQVDMGENYTQQFFVNLTTQKIVHASDTRMWDLAFQSNPNQHGIYINDANQMGVFQTLKTDFANVNAEDTNGIISKYKVDQASGELDSTAIGDWKTHNYVYIIKLNKTGNKICKMQFVSENQFEYIIKMGAIDEFTPTEIAIPKSPNQNHTYFSCSKKALVSMVEPLEKNNWDLHFCLYNNTFYDQPMPLPYSVTGVFLNPNNTFAYMDSTLDFASITNQSITSTRFVSQRDVIGYNWKSYDQDNFQYSIVKKYNYLIRNQNNSVFKLHFLDFYSSTGIKGSPKFEFQQIN